jgi:DNA-binding beta-propeller fold protein YncE
LAFRAASFQKFDSDFVFLTQWPIHGWESESVVNKPYLAVDGDGHVYITDPEGYRVIEFDAGGTFLTTFGGFGVGAGEFNLPVGIDVDELGNVYIADSANNRVMKFGPLGE